MTENKITFTQYNHPTDGQIIEQQYSSLYPTPQMMKDMEAILPGSADRVLKLAELQVNARLNSQTEDQSQKRLLIRNIHNATILGQCFSFLLISGGMILSGYLLIHDKPLSGFVSFLTPLAVAAATVLFQHNKKES